MNVSKKEMILVALVVMMAGIYTYFFTDWFHRKFIRIESTVRSLREAWGPDGRVVPAGKHVHNVTFALHKDFRITSVRVMPLAEARTNRHAHSLWTLTSESGSAPINAISYGTPIEGMAPSIATVEAEPLEPGVEYRLLVEAGSTKGTNDFIVPKRTASR